MKRTHDNFYLNEDNSNIKQSFVEVADEVSLMSFNSVADVGCAAGAFPNYLKKRFPNAEVVGIEYLENLITKAKADFPLLEFKQGNLLDKTSVKGKYDVITMLGVLCIFDDYKKVIENALSWLNPGGRLILQNMISEFDVDVIIKYKHSSLDFHEDSLESGWNIVSEKSLAFVAEANNAKIISSRPFHINVDLQKQSDVMRSWTENNLNGGKDIFNALHVKQPQRIVTIKKI
jgi:2-polyprenyl-3-methyl-5-hydroxy-6-metoxy-1,4-benzoquinol methylase